MKVMKKTLVLTSFISVHPMNITFLPEGMYIIRFVSIPFQVLKKRTHDFATSGPTGPLFATELSKTFYWISKRTLNTKSISMRSTLSSLTTSGPMRLVKGKPRIITLPKSSAT